MFFFPVRVNVLALIVFHITLSDDLDDLYVAELEEEPEKTLSDSKPCLPIKNL